MMVVEKVFVRNVAHPIQRYWQEAPGKIDQSATPMDLHDCEAREEICYVDIVERQLTVEVPGGAKFEYGFTKDTKRTLQPILDLIDDQKETIARLREQLVHDRIESNRMLAREHKIRERILEQFTLLRKRVERVLSPRQLYRLGGKRAKKKASNR